MARNENSQFYEQTTDRFLKSSYGVLIISVILFVLMPKRIDEFRTKLYLVSHLSLFLFSVIRFPVLFYFKKNHKRINWELEDRYSINFYYTIIFLALGGALSVGLMTLGAYIEFGVMAPHSMVLSVVCAGFTMIGSHNVSFSKKTIFAYIAFIFTPSLVFMLARHDLYQTTYWLGMVLFSVMCTKQVFATRKVLVDYSRMNTLYRSQVDYYKSILDAVPGMVTIFNSNLNYEIVNKQVTLFTGITDENLIGKKLGYFDHHSVFQDTVEQFHSSELQEDQKKVQLKNQYWEKWFMIAMRKIKQTGQLVVVSIDITEQVMMEEKSLEQRAMVESSARMAAIGELAAGIAHEINNPLGVITLQAEQTMRRAKQSIQDHELKDRFIMDLTKVHSTAFRIARIVKSLRALARDGEKDQFVEANMGDLLNDVIVLIEQKIQTHAVSFRTKFSPTLAIACRSTQISQVLVNLISNSIDAIQGLPEKWIEVEAFEQGPYTLITVTDSGKGIPKEVLKKLMTPFFTTKAAGVGTGLGLSISKRIIADHHGLFFYDENSPHTKFVIRIPTGRKDQKAA